MNIPEQKALHRTRLRERLAHVRETERSAESRTLCKQLLKMLPEETGTITAYFPLKDEADTRPILTTLLERGWQLYLPRFITDRLQFSQVTDLAALTPGAFHIPEPPRDSPALELASLQYALVPGRVFDRNGGRIGRGNGGYDRWLRELRAANPTVKVWGIALECQLAREEVPMEQHDQRVDAILTARGLMDTQKKT